ncbi:MAG: formate dehydrogenase subunit gamma [Proteobacteria bacterium]|nr:formate dehydrogenase subunit gamma [Pseudomonadota bacterium]
MAKPKNLILSSTVFERVVHWVLAGSCLFLFLTGFGLMFHSLSFIANFFPGGFYVMKLLHNIDGIIFGLAFLFALVAWGKDTLYFDEEDKKWFRVMGGYLWEVEKVPEAGKFNAGQKLFFMTLFLFWFIMMGTGIFMWFPIFPPELTRWLYALHALGTVVLGGFLVIHFYLGTYGNPGTFQVMGHGFVTKGWAKKHRAKWLRDVEAGRRSV